MPRTWWDIFLVDHYNSGPLSFSNPFCFSEEFGEEGKEVCSRWSTWVSTEGTHLMMACGFFFSASPVFSFQPDSNKTRFLFLFLGKSGGSQWFAFLLCEMELLLGDCCGRWYCLGFLYVFLLSSF